MKLQDNQFEHLSTNFVPQLFKYPISKLPLSFIGIIYCVILYCILYFSICLLALVWWRFIFSIILSLNPIEAKNKILFVCNCLPTQQNPTYPKYFLPLGTAFFFFIIFLNGKFTVITLNSRTNRPEQKVQTQIRLLLGAVRMGLHCLPFHLYILGTPFMGKTDLFKLYNVVISVVWVFTVTGCKILCRIL